MSNAKKFNIQVAMKIGVVLGIDWRKFDIEQFRKWLEVELGHGQRDKATNDDILITVR